MIKWFARTSQLGHLDPPSGRFDLVGDNCVGWVSTKYRDDIESFTIHLKRNGKTVASAKTGIPDKRRIATFSFKVSELATVEEFARESVTVSAVDDQGTENRLTIEGGTHVELIRRFMGQPQDLLVDIAFPKDGNAEKFIVHGWYSPELTHRWTEGTESCLQFEVPAGDGQFELSLLCEPYIFPPHLPEQRAEIYIDDELITSFSMDKKTNSSFVRSRIPGAVLSSGGTRRLIMHHPYAARPCDLGHNSEPRNLAFAYKKLVIARLKT